MTRYTVTYTGDALQALARLWLGAFDRSAVTHAGEAVDQLLRDDASDKGLPVGSALRQIIVAPLVVDEFTVEENDRTVTIWSVRHLGKLTNGL